MGGLSAEQDRRPAMVGFDSLHRDEWASGCRRPPEGSTPSCGHCRTRVLALQCLLAARERAERCMLRSRYSALPHLRGRRLPLCLLLLFPNSTPPFHHPRASGSQRCKLGRTGGVPYADLAVSPQIDSVGGERANLANRTGFVPSRGERDHSPPFRCKSAAVRPVVGGWDLKHLD